MNCVKSLATAAAFAVMAAGCASYDYGYSQPYAYGYDYGPYYYGPPYYYYGPGYYVGPPAVGFNFRYRDHDRHWNGDRGHDSRGRHANASGGSPRAPRQAASNARMGGETARPPRVGRAPAEHGARASADNSGTPRAMARSPQGAARAEQHG